MPVLTFFLFLPYYTYGIFNATTRQSSLFLSTLTVCCIVVC